MSDYSRAINKQYGQADLSAKILDTLEGAGKNLDTLTPDDLALFDQLHAGGRDATRALATMANLRPGMHVLDIGSGVGGPARTLAAEFGCQVIGLDLTETFCEIAEILTAKIGLSDQVTFRQGSALDLPFDDESFDVVWTQNTIMNIANKAKVFEEAHRVLKPEGILPLEAIMMGSWPEILYPVFWANDASVSFVIPPEEFQQLMAATGFEELIWVDVTAQVIEGASRQQAAAPAEPPPLGLHLVYDNVPEKGANTMRCFKEGRIIDIQAVYARSAER
ncbi:MAG: class I SAM-dependent methyltransferase [Planctomycetota bacterium]|jgi:SAM-dependent methyltransferase